MIASDTACATSVQGTGGLKKDIRGLLSTLHTVLWQGAKWEEVPISKLIDVSLSKMGAVSP